MFLNRADEKLTGDTCLYHYKFRSLYMKKLALVALAAAIAFPMASVDVMAMDEAKATKKMVKRGKKVAIKQCFA